MVHPRSNLARTAAFALMCFRLAWPAVFSPVVAAEPEPPPASWTLGEPRVIEGHHDWVWGVALSLDGKKLLTAGGASDHTAIVRDFAAGTELRRVDVPGGARSAVFLADGRRALIAGQEGTVYLWDTQTGTMDAELRGHAGTVFDVAVTSDGNLGASVGKDGTARLWDLSKNAELQQIAVCNREARAAAFSHDNRTLATGDFEPKICLWDAATWERLKRIDGHTKGVSSVAFTPDGKHVLSGGEDRSVRLWEVASGREVRVFPGVTNLVYSAAVSPDGAIAAAGLADKKILLWETSTGRPLATLNIPGGGILRVVFSRDGRHILGGCGDGSVVIFDLPKSAASVSESKAPLARTPYRLKGHKDWVWALALTSTGKRLVSGGGKPDHTAILWDLATGKELRRLELPAGAWGAVFLKDDQQVAIACEDKLIHVWDTKTDRESGVIRGHAEDVRALALNRTGQFLASAGLDGFAIVWNPQGQELLRLPVSMDGSVYDVAFSPNDRLLLTGDDDNKARLWDLASGQMVMQFNGHTDCVNSVAFTPDGRRIVTGSDDKTVRLWDVATGRQLKILDGVGDEASSVAVSPDGRRILAGVNGKVLVWDASNGKRLQTIDNPAGAVLVIRLSADGRQVFAGCADGSVAIHDLPKDDPGEIGGSTPLRPSPKNKARARGK